MNCIELTKELIKIDSSTLEGTNNAIDFCKNLLLENDLIPEILENEGQKMLVCTIGKGAKKIILNGHLDIVPFKKNQLAPYEKDGKLYGRGSADMKSGLASMICAFIELKNENLSCKVELHLVTDEETGGDKCSKYLAEKGFRGDFVICGEPTQIGIGVQAKGVLEINIDFFGKSAHGSRPWQGDNAIIKAYKSFEKILDLPFSKEKSELYDFPSINLAKISGGDVYNKVPDYCKMYLDIRFLPEQSAEEILNQIKSVVETEIHIHEINPPVTTKVDNMYVKALSKSIEKVTDNPVNIFGQHGSADTVYYSKYNIPAVEFGPSGANWHGDDEYVIIDSVYKYKDIIKDFILNIG
ncbi:M20 family metallopeptidase [Clostridium senegalense]